MKLNMYVIYDQIASEAGPIQLLKSDALALRMARQSLKDVLDVRDYALLQIGVFDTEACVVEVVNRSVQAQEEGIDE